MLNGGPVVWYIKQLHAREDCSLLLTGFQVEDTPGRTLMETGHFMQKGIDLDVKMMVKRLDFSAHIGRSDLYRFIKNLNPQKIFCMHGDNTEDFANELRNKGFDAIAPVANNRIFNF
jgi:putative mRNA 3-end processing factor